LIDLEKNNLTEDDMRLLGKNDLIDIYLD